MAKKFVFTKKRRAALARNRKKWSNISPKKRRAAMPGRAKRRR